MSEQKSIQFFVTCLIDSLFPEVGQAVVTVLERQGVIFAVPEGQTCCGQPAFNAGHWDEARTLAQHTIEVFEATEGPIVVASGSCGMMVAHEYAELFRDDAEWLARAERVGARIVEFTQYVVDHLGETDLGAEVARRVVYHPSCHGLRGLGIDRQPRALLEKVDGLEVRAQRDPETCCGFGGLFAVKMSVISESMLNNRIAAFEETGAEQVVGCDVSCLMHMEGGLRKRGSAVRTCHIAELLAEGLT